jgi:hypothetical protein
MAGPDEKGYGSLNHVRWPAAAQSGEQRAVLTLDHGVVITRRWILWPARRSRRLASAIRPNRVARRPQIARHGSASTPVPLDIGETGNHPVLLGARYYRVLNACRTSRALLMALSTAPSIYPAQPLA